MRTKSIPSIVMLMAGLVTCIYGIVDHTEIIGFLRTLLIVMIVFYILGSVVKVIIDHNFKKMDEKSGDAEDDNVDSEALDSPDTPGLPIKLSTLTSIGRP